MILHEAERMNKGAMGFVSNDHVNNARLWSEARLSQAYKSKWRWGGVIAQRVYK